MTALTVSAALALAIRCGGGLDPNLLVGIAQHESGLDPTAVHRNANGTTDRGLMQINDANFRWLGLTPETAMDPCRSMAAGAAVLKSLSAYNTGDGSRGIANGYSQRVVASVSAVKADGAPVRAQLGAKSPPSPTAAEVFWHPPLQRNQQ
jgi:hypothetical protein